MLFAHSAPSSEGEGGAFGNVEPLHRDRLSAAKARQGARLASLRLHSVPGTAGTLGQLGRVLHIQRNNDAKKTSGAPMALPRRSL